MTDRTPRPHHPAILGAGHVSAAGTATPHVKQARTRTVTQSAQRDPEFHVPNDLHRAQRSRHRPLQTPAAHPSEHSPSDAQEALAFAMKWRHWGGGDDEDIFVQFGLNTCQYFLRVRKLLSTPAAAALSPDEKAHLRQICFTRLHDGGLPTVESNPVAPHNS